MRRTQSGHCRYECKNRSGPYAWRPYRQRSARKARRKPCAQHLDVFLEKSVLLAAQEPHDLPLGDGDAQTGQFRGQARDRDLPLVVLAQNEALEVRSQMAGDALWQSGDHSLAGWKQPALAPVADRPRLDDDILDDEVLVAFEARALRQAVRLEGAGLVTGKRPPLGAAAAFPPGAPFRRWPPSPCRWA